MSTKKLQIIGNLGAKIYTQNDEPTDATEGAIWVDLDDEGAASSQVQPDWNQNNSTAPDYINNRPFYDDRQWKVVLEETEVLQDSYGPSGGYYGLYHSTIPSFFDQYPKGTVVKCVFGEKEYISTIHGDEHHTVIGNYDRVSDNGLGDTGENFAITYWDGTYLVACWDYGLGETFTVSISVLEGEIHKLDEKYLPSINLYVCSEGEYTTNGTPVNVEYDKNTTYLVPQNAEGTLYTAWVYANWSWQYVDTLTVSVDEADAQPAAKPVFFISFTDYNDNFLRWYDDHSRVATVQEVVDAYFAGGAYIGINKKIQDPTKYGSSIASRITSIAYDPNTYDGPHVRVNIDGSAAWIGNATYEDLEAAMAKYLP